MAKITVEVAAKRLGMGPEECLKRLQEMGIMVRDQLDKVDAEVFQQVKARLDEEKLRAKTMADSTSKRIGNRVIRRRHRKEEEEKAEFEEATPEKAEELPVETPMEQEAPAEEPPHEAPLVEEPAVIKEPASAEPVAVEPAAVPESESVAPPVAEPPAPVEGAPTIEAVSEEEPDEEEKLKGKKKKQQKKGKARKQEDEEVTVKQLRLTEITKEPAKILSKPTIPMEPLKPAVPARGSETREEAGGGGGGEAPSGDRRERRGRRVVDFATRSRRKEEQREIGFLRNRRTKKKKVLKHTEITTPRAIKRKVKVAEDILVGDLAKRMGIKAGDLIKKLLGLGMMVTINMPIDFDTATILATEFGFEVDKSVKDEDDILQLRDAEQDVLQMRPPVVTVMGHVDHGKTSLLDVIRTTDVASSEAGGITQHVACYGVRLGDGRRITFIDTPGHHSFAAMRARGAHITDIVILVVAADDGVMPQTIESINHAREAGVPIVVAVNKIDKPNADPNKISSQLMEQGIVSEALGGDTQFVYVSAKKREGIEGLLEAVLLQADVMELQADPAKNAQAVIVDARLERGRGPVADVIVKEGTLKKGDFIVAEKNYGRVRMMFDDRGNQLDEVGPAEPAQVIGLNGVPSAGVIMHAVNDEKTAKALAQLRTDKSRAEEQKKRASVSLEELFAKAQEGETKELKVVIKCDVRGSVEAVADSLLKLGNEEIQVKVIHSGVGTITETDVNLASPSEAIIIGFNVRPEAKAKQLAESLGVEIRIYNIIYDLIQEVKAALEGMLEPTYSEVVNGLAEVRNTFHIRKVGTVAGCYVLEGKILRNSKVRLIRDGIVMHTGNLGNLKRFKDDAREVPSGFECGISIDGCNDIQAGDKIESFSLIEERTTL